MSLNFNTLLTRTLTAAVFVAILISAVSHSFLTFTLLFFVITVWGLHEFFKITEKLGAKPYKGMGFLCAILIYGSTTLLNAGFLKGNEQVLYSEALLCFSLVFFSALFSNNEDPLKDAAYTLMGIVYCVIPFSILNYLACIDSSNINSSEFDFNSTYNHHLVLGLLLLIWANDSYAYLVGSLIGKNKLYEKISPGKTWEGTIGAAILTIASSWIISIWFPELDAIHWAAIAMIVSVTGTLGDLTESMLKRKAGIKDSGKIMPGHGGILDRFDSLMFIAPFVYLYLSFLY